MDVSYEQPLGAIRKLCRVSKEDEGVSLSRQTLHCPQKNHTHSIARVVEGQQFKN